MYGRGQGVFSITVSNKRLTTNQISSNFRKVCNWINYNHSNLIQVAMVMHSQNHIDNITKYNLCYFNLYHFDQRIRRQKWGNSGQQAGEEALQQLSVHHFQPQCKRTVQIQFQRLVLMIINI